LVLIRKDNSRKAEKKGSKEAKYSSGAITSAPSGISFSCFLQKVRGYVDRLISYGGITIS
jgi:hypothetical protein